MKQLNRIIGLIITALCFCILPYSAWAVREPRATAIDSRIKVMVYHADDVHKYTGYYGYQANIEFAEGEAVDNISMGDTTAWQIVPSGRRIFLKPMEADATTNMTVITNKRMYYFELHAKEAKDINDPNMVFTVRFLYPDDGQFAANNIQSSGEPDLSQPEKFNFDYTISGSEKVAPLKIFDDGEFTYFQFKGKNAVVPAFFVADSAGNEEIVNYRVAGRYIVLERVTSMLTLRHGKDIVCVFNEKMPVDDID